METKSWIHSKTIWIMALSLVGSLVAGITGENWFDGEMQIATLSFIGLILRIITKQGLST